LFVRHGPATLRASDCADHRMSVRGPSLPVPSAARHGSAGLAVLVAVMCGTAVMFWRGEVRPSHGAAMQAWLVVVRQRGSARGLARQARSVVFRQVRAWPGRARQAQRGRSRHVATLSCSCKVSQCKAVSAVSRASRRITAVLVTTGHSLSMQASPCPLRFVSARLV
jgi:hypothetical protein